MDDLAFDITYCVVYYVHAHDGVMDTKGRLGICFYVSFLYATLVEYNIAVGRYCVFVFAPQPDEVDWADMDFSRT